MSAIGLATRGYICPAMKKIVQQVPLLPAQGQALLVKALEFPLPPSVTEAQGIHQSDIILRTAIVAALADLRANPFLLDFVWASLPRDPLTLREYGELELQRAKEWFLQTDIPVNMIPMPQTGKWPRISIKLVSSTEAESTLGDVHYIPDELNDRLWPILYGPFTPKGYDATTGIITPPPGQTDKFVLSTTQFVVDRAGRVFPIVQVFDDGTFAIQAGTIADLTDMVIKNERPAFVTQLESASYREVYEIGIHVGSEPVYLTWLHSIVIFILLRYKQALLEARGLERSVLSSSDFDLNPAFDPDQPVYSRFVTLTGYVRHYWPKSTDLRISTLVPEIVVRDAGPSPTDPNDQTWITEADSLVIKPKT